MTLAMLPGSEQEQQELHTFRKRLDEEQLHALRMDREQIVYGRDFRAEEAEAQLRTSQMLLTQTQLLLCLQPLRRGVRPKSVLRTVGTFVAACLLSKVFQRNLPKNVPDSFVPALQELSDEDVSCQAAVSHVVQGAFVPVTPDGAAVRIVALQQAAYDAMRQCPDRKEQILQQYGERVRKVYALAAKDGVPGVMVSGAVGRLVYAMGQAHPSDARYLTELAYGQVFRPELEWEDLWNGLYVDWNGQEVTGLFHVRGPESLDALTYRQVRDWYGLLSQARTLEGLAEVSSSKEAAAIRERYALMLADDCSLDDRQYRTRSRLLSEDCRNRMYQNQSSLHAPGMELSAAMLFRDGVPKDEDWQLAFDLEYQSALGLWFLDHPEYNPAFWQRQANRYFCDMELPDGEKTELVASCLVQRDELMERWNRLCQKQTYRSRPLPSAGLLDKDPEELSYPDVRSF